MEHEEKCISVEECPGTCSGGKEQNECGSACPLTCDNYENPPFCTRQCVSGCFCPEGKVDLNGVCVNKTTCAGDCSCQQSFCSGYYTLVYCLCAQAAVTVKKARSVLQFRLKTMNMQCAKTPMLVGYYMVL